MKNLGCISAIAGLVITGMVVIGVSLLCFGVMAGIGETVVPEPHREGFHDWLSGIPPDDPAFVGGTDDVASEAIPEQCWTVDGWPLQGRSNGRITQHFHEGHNGVDIGVPIGTFVSAPSAGTVTWAGWENSGYGNLVIVTNGTAQFYMAHLAEPNVEVGQQVSAGDIVGLSGNSGRSTGPHLHYEIRVNGKAINPEAVPVDRSMRCIDPQRVASAGGTGGGGDLLASGARANSAQRCTAPCVGHLDSNQQGAASSGDVSEKRRGHGATWHLPADRRGWLLAAEVDPQRVASQKVPGARHGGIAPEETIVRLSDEELYVWPAGRSDLAVSAGAALRDHERVAVGPEPGTVWVTFLIAPAREYLVSIWKR